MKFTNIFTFFRDVNADTNWSQSRAIQELATTLTEFVFNINLDNSLPHPQQTSPAAPDDRQCFIPDNSQVKPHLLLPGLKSSDSVGKGDHIDGMYEVLLLQEKVVLQVVDRLKLCSHRSHYTPQKPKRDTLRVLEHLKLAFIKLYHLSLYREMRVIAGSLNKSNKHTTLTECLNILISLGKEQSDDVVFSVISQLEIVNILVNLCAANKTKELKLLVLRGLSSLCCTESSIRQLEAAEGIQTICHLLTSSTTLEVKVEAAGVLAQITSPWITENHRVNGLTEFIPDIVLQLSTLASLQCGEDSFLLVTAALANITFMEPTSLDIILEHNIWRLLTSRLEDGNSQEEVSVFVRDQVVTILANLAARESGRANLIRCQGITFLVGQLCTPLYCVDTAQELNAVERIIKKSAIALCRLCTGEAECKTLEAAGGIKRSVQLCEDGAARNYNDSILVSCLALLRRAANFVKIDQTFVHHNLVDSFRELTAAQESYV